MVLEVAIDAAHAHAAVGWFGPDELDALDWIPADRPLLPYLRAALGGGTTGADQGHCRA